MKKITIMVSGADEDRLARLIASGAAQVLSENWNGCGLQVEDVVESAPPRIGAAEPPSFMLERKP